ncbi:MAG: hypothetical protein AB8G22_07640 [Saprospiraceae bacterium]
MKHNQVLFALLFCLLTTFSAQAGVVILNGLSHIHQVNLGENYRGSIQIRNSGNADQDVKLYLRDYRFHHNGDAFYDEPNYHERSNTDWITLTPTLVTLKPYEERTIFYEINVPAEVKLDGTFWSVIMVEGIKDLGKTASGGVSINTQVRYAVQVATNMGETGTRELEFIGAEIKKLPDATKRLFVNVENKGERLLQPTMQVEIFDEGGNSVGQFTADRRKVYPETSTRFFVNLPQLPIGKYQALLLADCSDEDVFGINVELSVDE